MVAEVVEHTSHLFFKLLKCSWFSVHPRAQGTGQAGHPLSHLLHEHVIASRWRGSIRHALLRGQYERF